MGVNNYYTKVAIDGTDVTSMLMDYTFTDTALERVDSLNMTFNSAILTSGVALNPGSEVTVQRGIDADNLIYIFRGFVTEKNPQVNLIIVTAKNKLWALKQRQVTKSFDKNIDTEAGKLSNIILTLVTQFGGLNADSSSIQDSGTVFTLNKYLCVNDEVFERIMKLVDALGWQFYYNPINDKVYCEPYGFRNYEATVVFGASGSSVPLRALPTYVEDFNDIVNKVTVNGAKQLDTKTELFSGDDSTKTFTLTYTPQQTKVTIGGVEKTRGIKSGDTSTFDYWVEEDLKYIVFVTAPTTGTDNISVEYSAMVPVPVVLDDSDSIDLYCPTNPTTGEKTPYHKTITFNDIIDVDDAITRGKEYLSTWSTPYVDYTFVIDNSVNLFYPGLKVSVEDSINGFTGELVVNEVLREYPTPIDTIKLTDNRNFSQNLSTMNDRIKKLEQETLRNIGTLFHIKRLNTRDVDIQRRYTKMTSSSIAGETLIYDHPLYGIYDTAKYASATLNSFILGSTLSGVLGTNQLGSQTTTATTIRLIPGNGSFKEYLYDTEFVDTTNSTATVDTTNRRVYP